VSAIRLLNDLGRRNSSISGDTRETSHLYHRILVLVQRFNTVLLHDSLPVPDCTDWAWYPFSHFHQFLKPPSGIDTENKNNNNNKLSFWNAQLSEDCYKGERGNKTETVRNRVLFSNCLKSLRVKSE